MAFFFENGPLFFWGTSFISGFLSAGLGMIWREQKLKKNFDLSFQNVLDDVHATRERMLVAEEQAKQYERVCAENKIFLERLMDAQTQKTYLETTLAQERLQFQEKIKTLIQAREELSHAFQALSAQALERNNRSFLDLAQATFEKFHEVAKGELTLKEKTFSDLVSPIKESLRHVDEKMDVLEKERQSAYTVLHHQVGDLIQSQKDLRSETANLVNALRTPHIRGRWGEMQLRRVVEVSGLNVHCDFVEQPTQETDQGARLRPDMIVRLPGKKRLVIDAKAPLAAYLQALEAKEDSGRLTSLKDHARHVRNHILSLSSRAYWDQISDQGETPEFVILFLPGETIFSAALEHDPGLIEMGVEKRVILATPATLIALLHTVAYGWRQERLADNAREISNLGRELYKRLADMGGHLAKLGESLGASVGQYNKTIASLESRVLPSARRFKELDAAAAQQEIPDLPQLDSVTRELQSAELKRITY